MRKILIALTLAPLALAVSPAAAQTASVTDPVGDFLPTYAGPHAADLDVTSFSVSYDSVAQLFTLGATFAGTIKAETGGTYIFGVNTGTGPIHPFAALGQPNVIFNQAIAVREDGTGNIGATVLNPSWIAIAGNILTVQVPLSLLPSTGFVPGQYGFNLWPRLGTGNNNQISDFAPENATLAAGVPEPAAWGMLIAGFGAGGAVLRRRRRMRIAFS
jgi:hypothetical protein